MSVFDKARELSNVILQTHEFKTLDKLKIDKMSGKDVDLELSEAENEFNKFMKQVFLIIQWNVSEDLKLENNKSNCRNCNKCDKHM